MRFDLKNDAVELLVEMALVDHHFHDNTVNEKNNSHHSLDENTGKETINRNDNDTTVTTVDKDILCKKWRIAIDKVLL